MSYFKGDHLRIKTPVTTNGREIALDETGRAIYEYSFFPLSARKRFEAKNARILRSGLKHLALVIEVVNDAPQPQQTLEDFLRGVDPEQLKAALAAKGINVEAAPVVEIKAEAPAAPAPEPELQKAAPEAPTAAPKKAAAKKTDVPQNIGDIMESVKL